jgi:hypothetical protein
MKTWTRVAVLLVAIAYLAATASAQVPPLSQNAKNAFANWHECPAPGYPPDFFNPGARRFASNTITWDAPASLMAAATQTMATIQGFIPANTYVNIPFAEPSSANFHFKVGQTLTAWLWIDGVLTPFTGPLAHGCADVVQLAADKVTISYEEVTCYTASGSGLDLLMHEAWWHGHFSFCHTQSGCGAASFRNGAPWECVAGMKEAVRWIYSVPAGTSPQ